MFAAAAELQRIPPAAHTFFSSTQFQRLHAKPCSWLFHWDSEHVFLNLADLLL